MHLCRNAWQKLAPLTQRGAAALLRNASVRQMSSSSVPGSSGESSLPYYLLVGVAFTGGGFYAYRTLHRDKERFHDRHEFINSQLKPAFEDYESKSNKVEASAVSETLEEAVEAAIEEAAAEEVPEQEAAPIASLEQEQTAAEDEAVPVATELEQTAAEDIPSPTEQEPAPSTEAASKQVEPENIESVEETLDETSPVLEASSDNVTEELASAAEDWSELTSRKPEETVEETAPATQDTEEVVESEQASASS